ncbi:MAG: hypothetical protein GF333_05880 [Candidatus Omnitrophica bacterium]|nr:hypothetical protein [Candidatus Omnitrophota bacterium]
MRRLFFIGIMILGLCGARGQALDWKITEFWMNADQLLSPGDMVCRSIIDASAATVGSGGAREARMEHQVMYIGYEPGDPGQARFLRTSTWRKDTAKFYQPGTKDVREWTQPFDRQGMTVLDFAYFPAIKVTLTDRETETIRVAADVDQWKAELPPVRDY